MLIKNKNYTFWSDGITDGTNCRISSTLSFEIKPATFLISSGVDSTFDINKILAHKLFVHFLKKHY